MNKEIALITWTHNEYSDIWPMYFGRLDKHLKYDKSYIFLDKQSNKIPDNHVQLINNDQHPWHKRFLQCLDQVEEDYILYMQEDHIFYEDVDTKKLNELFSFFKDSEYSSLRLIKSGELGGLEVKQNIFDIPTDSQYSLSQQSAIWKKQDLKEIISFYRPSTFRDVEAYGSFAMNNLNKKSCYYHCDGQQRGSLHFDSKIFPYVATAICKGKWNLKQYPDVLDKAFKEYSVNFSTRGVYEL